MSVFHKQDRLYNILKLKCPRCHTGDLFLVKNAYKLKYLDHMPHYCPKCGEDFQREVGYYYGAMMISHGLTTLIAVAVHLVVHYFYGWAILPNIIPLLVLVIGLFPLVFRVSRSVWIHIFVKYDPEAIKNFESKSKSDGKA